MFLYVRYFVNSFCFLPFASVVGTLKKCYRITNKRNCVYQIYLLIPLPTMATTIDVEVLELCTKTVTNTPIINPAIGLDRMAWLFNTFPAVTPPTSRNAELRKLRAQTKKYRAANRMKIRKRNQAIFLNFSSAVRSETNNWINRSYKPIDWMKCGDILNRCVNRQEVSNRPLHTLFTPNQIRVCLYSPVFPTLSSPTG